MPRPIGDCVLVRPDEHAGVSHGGLYIPDPNENKPKFKGWCEVLDVPREPWRDMEGRAHGHEVARGDRVYVDSYVEDHRLGDGTMFVHAHEILCKGERCAR